MILLDTNVLSELMRPAPYAAVERWLTAQPDISMFNSAITEAELRYGATLLPSGKRRSMLTAEIKGMLDEDFGGRILPLWPSRLGGRSRMRPHWSSRSP